MPSRRLCFAAIYAAATLPLAHALSADVPASVLVAGKREDVIYKNDRKVYRAGADLQASTGSAADILNNIPSVEVDIDGVVSLRGDTSVTVLIDGKPSSMMQGAGRGSALQGFAAVDIEQIEVITSPSAEFSPDGTGGIINIVTKKNRKRGTAGQLTGNAGNNGRHTVAVSGNYNTGTLDVSGSLGDRKDWRRRVSDNQSVQQAVPTVSHQVQDEDNQRWYGKGGLKYAPDAYRSLGLTLDYASRNETRHSVETAWSDAALPFRRSGDGGGPRTDAALALTLEQKLAMPGEVLSAYLQRSHSIETNTYDYLSQPALPAWQRNFDQQVFDIDKFSAGYVRPDGSGSTLKLGYDIETDHNNFNNWSASGMAQPLLRNEALDNRYRYRHTANAVYGTYGVRGEQLEWLAGLRVEQVALHTLQQVTGERGTQHYRKLYPSLNLLYPLSAQQVLTAGYSKRLRKPDADELNPYINAADPKTLRQGNPALRPQFTDAFELGLRRDGEQSFGLSAYYRRSRDGETEVLRPVADGVVLISKTNMRASEAAGMEFVAAGKLLPGLALNLSGNAYYVQVHPPTPADGSTHGTPGFSGKGTLDYQASPRDRLQVSATYRGKRLMPQGYVLPVGVLNAGYRHQFDATLTLVATVSDLCNSQRNRRVYQSADFSADYRRQQLGRVLYLGVSVTLGGNSKARESEFVYD